LSAALNKDPRYLANIGRVSEQDLGIAPHNTARDRLIPLLRHMIGTNDPLSIYPFTESDGLEWLYCHEPHSDRSYALRNTGHEMTGDGRLSFPVGCTIVFDPIPRPESGDCVLARLDSGVTVFRQYVMDAGNPALHPLNPRSSVISSGFTVISVAIEVRLSLRG
jgi:SOS-response transcriptional repressor LexA